MAKDFKEFEELALDEEWQKRRKDKTEELMPVWEAHYSKLVDDGLVDDERVVSIFARQKAESVAMLALYHEWLNS